MNKRNKTGAADVHPDHRTRTQHLQIIRAMKRSQGVSAATKYWLTYCPRISKKAFVAA